MTSHTHIVFAGGGTGGHLFPGLATAEELVRQSPGLRITFAGSGKSFERQHATAAGFEYLAVPCRPLPRRAREAVPFLLENFAGYLAARRFLAEEHVDVVVGLGGYASVPMGRAARRRRVPLVLLEQNAVPGRATRWLAPSAALICLAMESAATSLRCRGAVHVTGNPIRGESGRGRGAVSPQDSALAVRRCARPRPVPVSSTLASTQTQNQLLILGGSGGARTLNENVPRALYRLRGELAGWRIIHQTGDAGLEPTRDLYRKFGLDATVAAFFDDMPRTLAASTLAVCRAGGTTLAELAAAGVPALLLPYPHAAGDHQRRNAEVFVKAGGAAMLDEREVPGRLDHRLADALLPLLTEPGRRTRMSLALCRLARPDAAADVAALIAAIAAEHPQRLAVAAAA
jgi:UDP-N-acetylglucosamine--N-acetylmuramyl-(pentapeptide) pyrophosphoryl-undecaprenol N-acetylglucosamine transferase